MPPERTVTSTAAAHPLDPLGEEGTSRASGTLREELRKGRDLNRGVRLAGVVLNEPPKEQVLSFEPGDDFERAAAVVLVDAASRPEPRPRRAAPRSRNPQGSLRADLRIGRDRDLLLLGEHLEQQQVAAEEEECGAYQEADLGYERLLGRGEAGHIEAEDGSYEKAAGADEVEYGYPPGDLARPEPQVSVTDLDELQVGRDHEDDRPREARQPDQEGQRDPGKSRGQRERGLHIE